ncbi:MAG TPA: hypothetical protein VFY87_27235 [Geminicoccaceae bacterium]|nr:hypothetical protein [Geminicoccaceae bacterium]
MSGTGASNPLLEAALNLARFHKEHERFYASSPLESAVRLQRHARALLALADRWSTVEPSGHRGVSPFEGAEDLNSEAATALDGVLFMEGEGRPAELTAMIGELRADAESFAGAGEWLANAMQASWKMAASMLQFDGLADVMGERHRIISNDWLAAHMQSLIGTLLVRSADMLERVDFAPAALRADLAGPRVAPRQLYAAAEVISRAADLCCESAELVHDNERRWRVTRERTEQLARAMTAAAPGPAAPATGDGARGGRGQHGPGASGGDTETIPAENR